jgi:DNA-directed RNA polymerase specialized sigma24 family protein
MTAPFPPVRPTAAELLCEVKVIKRWLRRYGVDPVDVEDMTAEVVIAAWRAGQENRYRPDPMKPDRVALIGFLYGVAWRVAASFLDLARHRYESPRGAADMADGGSANIEDAIIARDEMALLAGVRFDRRMIMIAHAAGCPMGDIAEAAGINPSTAWSRLRQGRLDLLAILKRRAARDR